eukprot:GEZU01017408.1.p1 GENE.GEZU01017408.1~~GEZU01017408.1.p1  ORF type:complete len:1030 (+),score=311.54 GEZU01017408.1:190-3090(+)
MMTIDKMPITGVGFRRFNNQYCLFVCTENIICSFKLTPRGELQEELDQVGCKAGCSTMSDEGELIVGKNDAVYFYDVDARGACYGFEGKKHLLSWFHSYLLVVSGDDSNRTGGASMIPGGGNRHQLNIYDTKNHLVAYSGVFNQITHILHEWGSIFVLCQEVMKDGSTAQRMYQLAEKDTQTKLEMLFRKNLYSIAINLAHSSQFDYAYIIDIFRKYGDHLYSKGDYDGAIGQYIRTIGKLEPSYVIRKFLDSQRIKNLTRYLEELHQKDLANSEHTTLLLNCYTKLKDVDKLDQFIKTSSDTLHYDIETAIRVCRQAGYYKHALYLSEKHSEHNWYLKIQIEDMQNYEDALAHIETLDFDLAESFMKKYGKILVTKLPDQTTKLLIRLCTGYVPKSRSKAGKKLVQPTLGSARAPAASQSAGGKTLLSFLTGDGSTPPISPAAISTPKSIVGSVVSSATAAVASSLETYRDELLGYNTPSNKAAQPAAADTASSTDSDTPQKSSGEEYIQCYTDQRQWLMVFLESVTNSNTESPTIMYNTLVELYLQEYQICASRLREIQSKKPQQRRQNIKDDVKDDNTDADNTDDDSLATDNDDDDTMSRQDVLIQKMESLQAKAMRLLKDPNANYDPQHALVLVQSHNFREGILYLYEKLGLHHDIIQYYMDQKDYKNIIESCKKYGDKESGDKQNMWVQVLSYFAEIGLEAEQQIVEVLNYIDRDNLLPPLMVIQILSQTKDDEPDSTASPRQQQQQQVKKQQAIKKQTTGVELNNNNAMGYRPKCTLGTIKDYIVRRLKQDQELISQDQETIAQYQTETKKMREEVLELQTSARIFQLSKCVSCSCPLDLPAIHFLCMHSYHHRCLGDCEECPVCEPKNRKVFEIKRNLEESAQQHEVFFKQLEGSNDGFSTVSEYFGRGIFNRVTKPGEGLDDVDDDYIDDEEDLLDEEDLDDLDDDEDLGDEDYEGAQ